MAGWIKIYRAFLEWEWYHDIPCKVLALHYLLSANFEDKRWRNQLIKRGQFVTSLYNLSADTRLSVQQIRTTNKKLTSSGFCHIRPTNKYTIVTICNYDRYQGDERGAAHATHKQTVRSPHTILPPQKMKREKETASALSTELPNISFLEFWEAYDKKVGRAECEKRWSRLSDGERVCLMRYIPLYKQARPDKRYRRNPETFLSRKSWNDELIDQNGNGTTEKKITGSRSDWELDSETPKDYSEQF